MSVVAGERRPPARMGRDLLLAPGQMWRDRTSGDVWRWDGEEFHRLKVGDVCLEGNRTRWRRWDGARRGWRMLPLTQGAVVTVTVCWPDVQLLDELCVVGQVLREDGRTYVYCRPWVQGAGEVVRVPFESVMPVARADEVLGVGGDAGG